MSIIIKGIIMQNIHTLELYENASLKFSSNRFFNALVIPHKEQPIHLKLLKYAKYIKKINNTIYVIIRAF